MRPHHSSMTPHALCMPLSSAGIVMAQMVKYIWSQLTFLAIKSSRSTGVIVKCYSKFHDPGSVRAEWLVWFMGNVNGTVISNYEFTNTCSFPTCDKWKCLLWNGPVCLIRKELTGVLHAEMLQLNLHLFISSFCHFPFIKDKKETAGPLFIPLTAREWATLSALNRI